jgi:hypothetical protein
MKDPNTNERSWIWIECHQVSQPVLGGLFLAVSFYTSMFGHKIRLLDIAFTQAFPK